MNIETLQIKRVTGNWDSGVAYVVNGVTVYGHKHYVPEKGELVMVCVGNYSFRITDANSKDEAVDFNATESPFIIVGDGLNSLEYLSMSVAGVGGTHLFIPARSLNALTGTNISHYIDSIRADSVPSQVDSASSRGDSSKLARADHTHGISKDTIINAIKPTDGYGKGYHNIQIGTSDPNTANVKGNKGDIYIRYEQTVE